MSMRTQRILLAAGYMIYRLDLKALQIRYASSPGGWAIFKKFGTQSQCKGALSALLMSDKNLED